MCNSYFCKHRVLFFGLLILCCVAAVLIRKKKARKNRITHSMFLERLRERIEHQMIEEANNNSQGGERANGIYYTRDGQNIGIGLNMNADTDRMVAPVGIPTHLFLANRAPPAYTEVENPNSNATESRSEEPPSYDSIFTGSSNNNNNTNSNTNNFTGTNDSDQ